MSNFLADDSAPTGLIIANWMLEEKCGLRLKIGETKRTDPKVFALIDDSIPSIKAVCSDNDYKTAEEVMRTMYESMKGDPEATKGLRLYQILGAELA